MDDSGVPILGEPPFLTRLVQSSFRLSTPLEAVDCGPHLVIALPARKIDLAPKVRILFLVPGIYGNFWDFGRTFALLKHGYFDIYIYNYI